MESKGWLWTGRVASGLVVAFLLVDALVKVLTLGPAMEGTLELGYPVSVVFPLGVILLLCVATYVVPRTSVLGALLLPGYLGGAVATHLRVGNPMLGYTLFPVYVGVLVWGGLYLRNSRVRAALTPSR